MKVILLMAVTADGMIAKSSSEIIDWTGKEDKQYFAKTTRKAGVVIMGAKTYDMIGQILPDRKNIVMTKNSNRKSHNKNLLFTDHNPHTIIDTLTKDGFESVVLIGGSTINTLFFKENLIDEIHITVVPKIFGKGLSLFDNSFNTQLELIDVGEIDHGHVLLKYRIKK